MKAFEPENGLVIRYDYLWRSEAARGLDHGLKDRPSAIMLVLPAANDRPRRVLLCAITHTEPPPRSGVAVPAAVRAHLGLDDAPSWIVTSEYNEVPWPHGIIPYGVMPVRGDNAIFGHLPPKLFEKVRDQLIHNRNTRRLGKVPRE